MFCVCGRKLSTSHSCEAVHAPQQHPNRQAHVRRTDHCHHVFEVTKQRLDVTAQLHLTAHSRDSKQQRESRLRTSPTPA